MLKFFNQNPNMPPKKKEKAKKEGDDGGKENSEDRNLDKESLLKEE